MRDQVRKSAGRGGQHTIGVRPMPSEREIRALISLLGDDDHKIVAMVRDNLMSYGKAALPYLEEVFEHEEPRLRLRARHIASQIRVDVLETLFRNLAASLETEFDLEEALCVIARIEYPNLDPRAISEQFEEMADALRPQMPRVAPARERVEILLQYLFRELGFKGNTNDFYNPDNSYINKVLEHRLGIPISLSAITILLGRRLGLSLYGVGMPKHFLVKYQDDEEEFFIDPFNGGRVFDRRECMQMLTSDGYYVRESFAAEYLAVVNPRDLVIRMLRNLVLIYSKLKDKSRVKRLSHYVEILRMREKARG